MVKGFSWVAVGSRFAIQEVIGITLSSRERGWSPLGNERAAVAQCAHGATNQDLCLEILPLGSAPTLALTPQGSSHRDGMLFQKGVNTRNICSDLSLATVEVLACARSSNARGCLRPVNSTGEVCTGKLLREVENDCKKNAQSGVERGQLGLSRGL